MHGVSVDPAWLHFANGDRYVGAVVNHAPHGFGAYTYANGENFTGTFSGGMRHGKGSLATIDGATLEQCYERGKLTVVDGMPVEAMDAHHITDYVRSLEARLAALEPLVERVGVLETRLNKLLKTHTA